MLESQWKSQKDIQGKGLVHKVQDVTLSKKSPQPSPQMIQYRGNIHAAVRMFF